MRTPSQAGSAAGAFQRIGPTYVGAASDIFAARGIEHSLQIALYTLTPFYLIAIGLFLWLARILRRETRNAAEVPA